MISKTQPQIIAQVWLSVDGREYALDGLQEAFPFIPTKGDFIKVPKLEQEVLVTKVLHQFYNSSEEVIQNIKIEGTTKKQLINAGVFFAGVDLKLLPGLSEWVSKTGIIPQKSAKITALPEDSNVMGIEHNSFQNNLTIKEVSYRHATFDVAIMCTYEMY
jgi:hypothetical protein